MPQMTPLVLTKAETKAREQFLAERKTCVGGSDIQHLLGLEFGCERRLFYDKAGVKPDFPDHVNNHIRRGILLESIAKREYSAATGRKLFKGQFARHPKFPFMGVHLDGRIRSARGVPEGTLESKIPTFRAFRSYKQTQQPAASYVVQAHYNAFVAGATWSSIDIFNPDQMETLWFDQQLDKDIVGPLPEIVGKFWDGVRAYWQGTQLENPYPKLERTDKRCATCPWRTQCQQLGATASVLLGAAADEIKGVEFEIDDDATLAAKALELRALNRARLVAEKQEKAAKRDLEDMLGERNAVEVPDAVRIYWQKVNRDEKAKPARKTSYFSLKVIPLSQQGDDRGQEAEPEADLE